MMFGWRSNGAETVKPKAEEPVRAPVVSKSTAQYFALKSRLHKELIERMDLAIVATLPQHTLRQELQKLIEVILVDEPIPLNAREREQLVREIQYEVMGLGPLEPLLNDPGVSDILVNTASQVYVERAGKLELAPARFQDNDHLRKIIEKIVSTMGRRIDESSPMVDARLPDGSRVNAVIPPLSIDGPLLSIRRFSRDLMGLDDLVGRRTLTPEMGQLLRLIVLCRLNVLISGGTGCGKTTLLNVLSSFIPATERVITIEDSAELQLRQDHVVRLETRPPNIEGRGEVTQRDLLKNSLRMRPDRIILGEVRGSEALDMLQAMNTGHDGSLTTIHANTPRDALSRVETMVAMTGFNLPTKALRHYMASAFDVIIQATRLSDGTRKVTSVQEVTGVEDETLSMDELFYFEQTGVGAEGQVKGMFRARGIRPKFLEKAKSLGLDMPAQLFDPNYVYDC
jgi:pilus assembly protein CpaF